MAKAAAVPSNEYVSHWSSSLLQEDLIRLAIYDNGMVGWFVSWTPQQIWLLGRIDALMNVKKLDYVVLFRMISFCERNVMPTKCYVPVVNS